MSKKARKVPPPTSATTKKGDDDDEELTHHDRIPMPERGGRLTRLPAFVLRSADGQSGTI
jgi:hypothetical protein